MLITPKITLVVVHVFPGSEAMKVIEWAILVAQGMSCATIRFEFNERTIEVNHHSVAGEVYRRHFPELCGPRKP
jgi:hypothetical protein